MLDTNMEETVSEKSKIIAQDVRVLYGDKEALRDVNIRISEKMVTAFIGPSGCGKSTFLRCFNRMNDTIPICRVEGKITLDGDHFAEPSPGLEVIDEIGEFPAGSTELLVLTLDAGNYQLVCNLPGHYAAGMHTSFVVS